jgi:hypothetical protein
MVLPFMPLASQALILSARTVRTAGIKAFKPLPVLQSTGKAVIPAFLYTAIHF